MKSITHPLHVNEDLRTQLTTLIAAESDQQARAEFSEQHAAEMLARIAWARLIEPGDRVAGALINSYGAPRTLEWIIEGCTAKELFKTTTQSGIGLTRKHCQDALDRWRPRLDRAATITDITHAITAGLKVILPHNPLWPAALNDLGEHTPVMLWVRGNSELLNSLSCSVVGARAATSYGSQVTAELVDHMSQSGVSIVSGAAYGIDAVAHRAALAAEAGTIAVLAGGADRIYPSGHDALISRIAAQGLVCSEMVPGAAPTKWRFRSRNRLIAALSPATLVTEAGVRSGTLNTAGHAAELGRSIGAVPGPITSATSQGCHLLIQEYGASLVSNAHDALALLGTEPTAVPQRSAPQVFLSGTSHDDSDAGSDQRSPDVHTRVCDAIPLRGCRETLDIARNAGLSERDTRDALAELELLGMVSRNDSPGRGSDEWRLTHRK